MAEPYHRFVFDQGRFVGAFEDMYAAGEREGFDPWHQDSVGSIQRIGLSLVSDRTWRSALDFGCGKGAVTSRIPAGRIVGIDISETAVLKARSRFPRIDWRVGASPPERERFELVVAFEVLSYVEDWRGVLRRLAGITDRLLVSLHLPVRPAGFVKSFDELRGEFGEVAAVEEDVAVLSRSAVVLFGAAHASLL